MSKDANSLIASFQTIKALRMALYPIQRDLELLERKLKIRYMFVK